jgi:chromosome segregation ATPase
MKRLMATVMVVGMAVTGFSGVAMAAETAAEAPAKAAWSESTQAKIDQARENRSANHALREEIKGQRATIHDLIGKLKSAVGHDLKESFAQRREALRARREGAQALKDQMAEVKAALKEAMQKQDKEAAAALKSELETLRKTAEAEFGDWKAESEELKSTLEELKADRQIAKEKREELKPLFEQAKAIHDALEAQRAEYEPVKAAIQAAREAHDDAALSAALDKLLPLQEQRHELLADLSGVLDQIIDHLK